MNESSAILWDASDCCDENTNGFFQILHTLTGWKSRPTVVTTVVYFLYWFCVLLLVIWQKVSQMKKNKSASNKFVTKSTKFSDKMEPSKIESEGLVYPDIVHTRENDSSVRLSATTIA